MHLSTGGVGFGFVSSCLHSSVRIRGHGSWLLATSVGVPKPACACMRRIDRKTGNIMYCTYYTVVPTYNTMDVDDQDRHTQ